MVLRRVRTNHDRNICVFNLVKRCSHGTRANIFHQSRHGRGVAQTGAVVHIVMFESLTDQFLEEVCFLIRAFSRTKARDRRAAAFFLQLVPTACRYIQRFFP